jgi:hypothetical protein
MTSEKDEPELEDILSSIRKILSDESEKNETKTMTEGKTEEGFKIADVSDIDALIDRALGETFEKQAENEEKKQDEDEDVLALQLDDVVENEPKNEEPRKIIEKSPENDAPSKPETERSDFLLELVLGALRDILPERIDAVLAVEIGKRADEIARREIQRRIDEILPREIERRFAEKRDAIGKAIADAIGRP